MDLLTLIDGDEVRSSIDASLAERNLPNATIKGPLRAGRAITELLSRIPNAAGLADQDAEKKQHIANALNLLTAARCVHLVPNITQEDYGDGGGYKRQALDPDALESKLRDDAFEEVALVLEGTEPTTRRKGPPGFAVARGRRGV